MVRKEVDAGLLYVLMRNMELTARWRRGEGEDDGAHLHEVQEELEKQADPRLPCCTSLRAWTSSPYASTCCATT